MKTVKTLAGSGNACQKESDNGPKTTVHLEIDAEDNRKERRCVHASKASVTVLGGRTTAD